MSKKLLLFFATIFILAPILPIPSTQASIKSPTVYSNKAITIVAETGEVVYSKKGNYRDFPASTTKVLTGLLLLEKLKPTDTITMTSRSLQEERSNDQIIFKSGEEITRDEALKILMLNSNNNIAYAIGQRISGSVSKFADLMNKRAKELGATNSHFANASGLPNSTHKTTAYDLAMITREAIKQPLMVKAMSLTKTYVKTSRQKVVLTKSSPIYSNPNFLAAKTGYTKAAKNTLIQANKKNNITLIHVVLRSDKDKYSNDIKLLDQYAYSKVKNIKLVDHSTWKTNVTVLNQRIEGKVQTDIVIPTAFSSSSFKTKIIQDPLNYENLFSTGILPLQNLGRVEVYLKSKKMKQTNFVSSNAYTFNGDDLVIPASTQASTY